MDSIDIRNNIDRYYQSFMMCQLSSEISSQKHPLRVLDAFKSIVGTDLNYNCTIIINWMELYYNYCEKNKHITKQEKFKLKKTPDIISYKQLEEALINKDSLKVNFFLNQLMLVSDGTQVLEYLLEHSLKQSGNSTLFIWSNIKLMKFLNNIHINEILLLLVNSILDDDYVKPYRIVINKHTFLNKMIQYKNIEMAGLLLDVYNSDLIRKETIHNYLSRFLNSKFYNISNIEEIPNIENLLDKIDVYGRKGILYYLNDCNIDDINPNLLLQLNGLRTVMMNEKINKYDLMKIFS